MVPIFFSDDQKIWESFYGCESFEFSPSVHYLVTFFVHTKLGCLPFPFLFVREDLEVVQPEPLVLSFGGCPGTYDLPSNKLQTFN